MSIKCGCKLDNLLILSDVVWILLIDELSVGPVGVDTFDIPLFDNCTRFIFIMEDFVVVD